MSNIKEIKVPDIGDFDKVPIIEVLVSEGDDIEKEQSLVTLESDKATMEVPASAAGKLVELKVSEGDEVGEGDVIGVIEVSEDAGEASESDESEDEGDAGDEKEKDSGASSDESDDVEEADDSEDAEEAEPETGNRKPETESSKEANDLPAPPVPFDAMDQDLSKLPHASPAVRKLARELGVDLTGVEGSGRKGRITEEDLKGRVKQAMESGGGAAAGTALNIAEPPQVDFSKFGEIEEEKLSRIKQISGPALHRNWVSIPHVTQFDEADITEMEAFRKASKKQAEEAGTKMTPLVFLIKAVVAGLKAFPHFNASLSNDGKKLIKKKYFHIGVAVDTPNGLVVPVIRDADQKGLIELAQELTDLSTRARDGKLKGDEMKGGCFSISSLGGIGGTAFTPIINAPELAILGVSRSETKPVWDGEQFQPRLMLPLSLSYDHRVIDGADAARFTRYLAKQLEDLRRLLL
ncbi:MULTISPECIES: dihydrolipoyllysine-residue acetyltransferase [unclassified Wenzhouxiangella]|uniref:dihydrolipoyllysine-residue acetyltransferase n=1 Tax=unclassified Wenzhouxiangella TaxID=2613841 RepID=UPI000E32753F|nr:MULTISPECIES: dihydrolipoyllysine-residue acetyltransferase [unclassified Wenzhouxiangella]RFF27916.1 branched-chain alpha-keto acid dehydrogenase subunit E2 [Wenzhouxiangella sp. 15181]RFP67207.1 branched-chain alpha-keto acid dehydrogenase subunit E2 [Wenzhouxiangella sp. 15190]